MRVVILGAGSVGTQLAKRLADEGKDVVIVERDPDVARVAANALDCLVVQGDGSLPETLARARLGKASHFVALTGSDELNIVTCSVVASEHPEIELLARVRNPYYSRLAPERRSFMGIGHFVNPDVETARAFLALLSQGADEELVRFEDEGIVMRAATLAEGDPLEGRPLKASRAAAGRPFLAAALVRGSAAGPAEPAAAAARSTEVPSGETVPLAGDRIFVLGAPADLEAVLGPGGPRRPPIRRVVIAGGGPIARLVAEGLRGKGADLDLLGSIAGFFGGRKRREVVMVERDMAACKQLAKDLPEVLVINRDLAEEEIFLEEGLGSADAFVALERSQERNLLAAARAKEAGVPLCLALADNSAYLAMASRLGIDSVLSVKSNVVTSIVELLRGGGLSTLHSFFDRGLKILELSVAEGDRVAGRALRDVAMPRGSLAIYLSRGGASALPEGSTTIAVGDRLGILTTMGAIREVEKAFLGERA